jgi:hypothetical protein
MHSRQIADYGGVINTMPMFAAFMVLFAMANAGLPGTSGFVGEFLVILASFKANFWYAFLAAVTLILGAAYTLWLVKRVVFGPIGNDQVAHLTDLNNREFFVLGVLARRRARAGPVAGAAARRHAADARATGAADDADEGLSHEPGIHHSSSISSSHAPEIFMLAADLRRARSCDLFLTEQSIAVDDVRAVVADAGRRMAWITAATGVEARTVGLARYLCRPIRFRHAAEGRGVRCGRRWPSCTATATCRYARDPERRVLRARACLPCSASWCWCRPTASSRCI